jgi:hypothetical protein
MAGNNHIVNSTGRGSNAFSNTFHALRRTQDGKLYYTLRDTHVGTFSNDGGTTELSSDADFLEVSESFISGQDETFTGNGSLATRTLTVSPQFGDRIAVFVDRKRLKETTDYTLEGTTLTFTRAPHDNAEIFVRKIGKTYKNDNNNTYQQYKFENGRNHYKLNSNGRLVKKENRKMPIDESNFPDDVLDSEFAAYNGNALVNTTTYKA